MLKVMRVPPIEDKGGGQEQSNGAVNFRTRSPPFGDMASKERKETKGVSGAYIPIAVVFLLGLASGIIANLFVVPFPIVQSTWIAVVGVVPLAVGAYLFVSARRAFRRRATPLMPWKATTQLVQDGPYMYTRNPIYLALALWFLAASLIFNSAYLLDIVVVVVILFDRTQIPREERYLEDKFGEEYARYKSKVRWWI